MKRNTKRPWFTGPQKLALGVGILAVGGALFVLLESSFKSGQWTSTDVILPVALAITIGAGKLAYSALSERVFTSAAGFTAAFLIGTTLVVLASVGKQASHYDAETSAINHANSRITAINDDIARSEKRLAVAEAEVEKQIQGVPKYNKRGKRIGWHVKPGCPEKGRCADWKLRAREIKSHIERLRSQKQELGPARKADPRANHWAEVLILFGLAAEADRPAIIKGIALLQPILTTLLLELTSCWALGFAFHRRKEKPAVSSKPAPASAPTPPNGGKRTKKSEAQADIIQLRKPIPQETLTERWGVTKGTASAWLTEFEIDGLVKREREGKRNIIVPVPRMVRVA